VPKRVLQEESLIEGELIGCPDDIGIARLKDILRQEHSLVFNRRTLQRRLQKLIDQGRAVAINTRESEASCDRDAFGVA